MSVELPVELFQVAKKTGLTQSISRPSLSYWQDAWIRLKKNKQAFISLVIITFLLLFILVGPFLWSTDPASQDLGRISEAPGLSRNVKVIPESKPYEESVVSTVPETGSAEGAALSAPLKLELMDIPTVQTVRLKWAPVQGASGYRIYRSDKKPESSADVGVPLNDIEGATHVSYEDTFNLESGIFYYSILSKGSDGNESPSFTSIPVQIEKGISYSEAQELDPNSKPGDTIRLKSHPMGTDYLGRDALARLMSGGRVSLYIGLLAPFLATILGLFIGGISGYFGGSIDNWLMRITDFVMALPFLLFMILFKVVLGAGSGESGIAAMLISMVLLSWTGPARLVRGQILQLREAEFVQAARLLGAKPFYIIARHMLPNTLGVILVSVTFSIPTAIFTEAFLSFIGMGVVPPTPSWGSMCNDGIQTFLTHPHEFLFPAVAISLAVLAFNLFGDGLRDALDPKMRSR